METIAAYLTTQDGRTERRASGDGDGPLTEAVGLVLILMRQRGLREFAVKLETEAVYPLPCGCRGGPHGGYTCPGCRG